MRPIRANPRRRPLWRTTFLILAAVVGISGLTVGSLVAMKIVDPAKLAFWKSKREIPKGWITVPICARPIPPYTTVTGDYLTDPKTFKLAIVYKSPKAVPKGTILDIEKIRGRVTAHAVGAFFNFTEDDFLPEGTRPGIAGGTPPGKRAITLDAENLKGAHELKEGDHFDLLASVAVDMPGTGRSSTGQFSTKVVAAPNATLLPKRSLVKPLVQDGVVVTPMRVRNVPISSTSLTQGATTRTKPVQEIIVAVEPDEVAPLAEAMDLKYEITCVARSGRPTSVQQSPVSHLPAGEASQSGLSRVLATLSKAILCKDSEAASGGAKSAPDRTKNPNRTNSQTSITNQLAMDITPGLNPMAQISFLEVMIGPQRQFMLFTGPGNSPVVAMQDGGSPTAGSEVGAMEESKQ